MPLVARSSLCGSRLLTLSPTRTCPPPSCCPSLSYPLPLPTYPVSSLSLGHVGGRRALHSSPSLSAGLSPNCLLCCDALPPFLQATPPPTHTPFLPSHLSCCCCCCCCFLRVVRAVGPHGLPRAHLPSGGAAGAGADPVWGVLDHAAALRRSQVRSGCAALAPSSPPARCAACCSCSAVFHVGCRG